MKHSDALGDMTKLQEGRIKNEFLKLAVRGQVELLATWGHSTSPPSPLHSHHFHFLLAKQGSQMVCLATEVFESTGLCMKLVLLFYKTKTHCL